MKVFSTQASPSETRAFISNLRIVNCHSTVVHNHLCLRILLDEDRLLCSWYSLSTARTVPSDDCFSNSLICNQPALEVLDKSQQTIWQNNLTVYLIYSFISGSSSTSSEIGRKRVRAAFSMFISSFPVRNIDELLIDCLELRNEYGWL